MYQRLLYGLGAPVTKSFRLGLTKYSEFFCIYTRQYFKNVSTANILLAGLVTCSNMCALLLNF